MVALFNIAMKDDIVNKNYASLIELPKGEPESTRTAFTDEQLELIRKYKDKVPYADVVLFMCYTGWRPTEMSLLAPDSVDKENWIITGGIKTPSGKNRKVPVHPSIQPIVSHWMDKGFKTLFADEKGQKLNKDTWATRFHGVMKSIFKDEDIVPYTTRHTCASILHAAGVDGVNIAKINGTQRLSDHRQRLYSRPVGRIKTGRKQAILTIAYYLLTFCLLSYGFNAHGRDTIKHYSERHTQTGKSKKRP